MELVFAVLMICILQCMGRVKCVKPGQFTYRAGVCLLKVSIDRPKVLAFPAERLLTRITMFWGAAPASIKHQQQLQLSTAFGGEKRMS